MQDMQNGFANYVELTDHRFENSLLQDIKENNNGILFYRDGLLSAERDIRLLQRTDVALLAIIQDLVSTQRGLFDIRKSAFQPSQRSNNQFQRRHKIKFSAETQKGATTTPVIKTEIAYPDTNCLIRDDSTIMDVPRKATKRLSFYDYIRTIICR